MRLSAIDCIGRGVANLRANWELALMQFAQIVGCTLLVVAGGAGLAVALGVSLFADLAGATHWQEVVERLQGLSLDWGLLVILFSGALILSTLLTLLYCWFQAGIFATLERGERQAPPLPRVDPQLFRTFEGRSFWGWASGGVWRFFWFVGWTFLVAGLTLGVLVIAATLLMVGLADSMGPGVLVLGCLALLPVLGLAVALNFWMLYGQALLPLERFGVFAASRRAWRILRRRVGSSLLLALLFFLASLAVAMIFGLLSQILSLAFDGTAALWVPIQVLLTLAQWLASSIVTVGFLGSVVALVRDELDAQAA